MNRQGTRPLLLGLVGLLVWAGCGNGGGDDDDLSLSKKGQIEIEPADEIVEVDIGLADIGATIERTFVVRNVGNGPLTLENVSIAYTAPEGGDSHAPAFQLKPFEVPVTIDEGSDTVDVTVVYTRQEVFASRSATLLIQSDSRFDSTLAIAFIENAPLAVAVVQPPVLDFGTVAQGTAKTLPVTVSSTGSDTLVCHAFALEGHPDFTFKHPQADKSYPVSEVTATKAELDPVIEVEPNQVVQFEITFAPESNTPGSGSFTLFCNDPALEGHSVVILANNEVPCIQVKPDELLFGGKAIGTKDVLPVEICNCGTAPLKISGVSLSSDSDIDFGLIFDYDIDPAAPLVVPINECIEASVRYVPDVVSPLDPDNQPIPDQGTLIIENNSFESEVEVPITGTGVEIECPVAVITIQEGEEVVPQTTLHLKGDQSYSPFNVPITIWEWSVSQPDGSTSIFIPSASHDNPVFTVNVAGVYGFDLTVRDELGKESCVPAHIDVIVIPDEAIHVELVWNTPGDEDTTDTGEGKGSDLDLHFAHPFASGPDIDGDGEGDPWYDEEYDTFWFFKTHNWGTFSPDVDDDPHLDLDDIDGWGPENLNLNIPEAVVYRVGVNYWNHHGFGASFASVRFFLYGQLVVEVTDVELENHDMWYVADIDMTVPEGKVDLLETETGEQRITPKYINANFLPPISSDDATGGP